VIIPVIRPGGTADLEAIAAIQSVSPEASQWNAREYLQYDLRVAVFEKQIAGFLVSRAVGSDEHEILNLAVSPQFRRRGIASHLVQSLLEGLRAPVFLEVRASNRTAIEMYKSLGFKEIDRRPQYYDAPLEAAIVMKFHSC
jgi:[ribosomal protein S18]-alanine N-acetyltransferase